MTADILGLIDGALEDWELSGDAMRWTAEPPDKPELPNLDRWGDPEHWLHARFVRDLIQDQIIASLINRPFPLGPLP